MPAQAGELFYCAQAMSSMGSAASDTSTELTNLDAAQDRVERCRIYSKDCQVEERHRDRLRASVMTHLVTLDAAYRHAEATCRAYTGPKKPPSK
jgi:hypothetical protein